MDVKIAVNIPGDTLEEAIAYAIADPTILTEKAQWFEGKDVDDATVIEYLNGVDKVLFGGKDGLGGKMAEVNEQIEATREKISKLSRELEAYQRVLEILETIRDGKENPEYDIPKKVWGWGYYPTPNIGGQWDWRAIAICPNCHKSLVPGEIHVCI